MVIKKNLGLLFSLLVISLFLVGCWGGTKEKLAVCNSTLETCKGERDTFKSQADDYKTKYDSEKASFQTYKQDAEKREADLKTQITEKETKLTDCEAGKNQCVGELKVLRTIRTAVWGGLIFEILMNIGFAFFSKSLDENTKRRFVIFSVSMAIILIASLVYFHFTF